MNIFKTGALAAAAAVTLALPAAALAQPFYHDHGPAYVRHEDFGRFDRDRAWRRAEEYRHLRWEDSHRNYGGYRGYYGR